MSKRTDAELAIEQFLYQLALERCPPAKAMGTISECFERYLSAKGSMSLDEAFFGAPHKKRASYAFRKSADWRYRFFYLHRKRVEKLGLPRMSLEQLADVHLANDDDTDRDSFLRSYHRWKVENQIED